MKGGQFLTRFRFVKSQWEVADYIESAIASRLEKGQSVLWLVAGGSVINIAALAANKLKSAPNLNSLTVTLTDERYGPNGHPDSNWAQLINSGFSLSKARLRPVLTGKNMKNTALDYESFLGSAISAADYSIALAGMGPDGHIFGIKPHSPALDGSRGVAAYEWSDYQRITPTIKLIEKLDEVVIYAVGPEKYNQIDMLSQNVDPAKQPAQLLKRLKKVEFFNDYKEEDK